MTDNVIKLVSSLSDEELGVEWSQGIDDLLDQAKGQDLVALTIIGQREDSSMLVVANVDTGDSLLLMELAKRVIVFGDDDT